MVKVYTFVLYSRRERQPLLKNMVYGMELFNSRIFFDQFRNMGWSIVMLQNHYFMSFAELCLFVFNDNHTSRFQIVTHFFDSKPVSCRSGVLKLLVESKDRANSSGYLYNSSLKNNSISRLSKTLFSTLVCRFFEGYRIVLEPLKHLTIHSFTNSGFPEALESVE